MGAFGYGWGYGGQHLFPYLLLFWLKKHVLSGYPPRSIPSEGDDREARPVGSLLFLMIEDETDGCDMILQGIG